MTKILKNKHAILILLTVIGLFLRLYHIEFGLPHSFHADEPEIVEPAIKYTYEIRNIIKNNNYYKLIPISFVYGTWPIYFNTIATMVFSKSANLLGTSFEKYHIYIFLRILNAVSTFAIIPIVSYLAYKLSKSTKVALLSFFLLTFNWKFIVHAHYINSDITQTVLLCASYLTLYLFYKKSSDTKYTVFTGILYGLAVGTKITTLLSFPLFLYIFIVKKSYREMFAFIFIVFGIFIISNPFSMILANNFAFRVYTMFSKEAGLVFDSVDYSPFKYISALSFMVTPLVSLLSIKGLLKSVKSKTDMEFHIFLIFNVVIYLVFFSLQSRRVDRWLLPIIPIILIYASFAISQIRYGILTFFVLGLYCYYPALLLRQFQRHTPKSYAYIWMKDNIDPATNKFSYTEEGLDPLNKLPGMRVLMMQVYPSQNAQYFMPENVDGYDYVVTASKPMANYKRMEVMETYPLYYERWNAWENNLLNVAEFELIKKFTLPKPNLINLSDVYIYKNLNVTTYK